MFSGPENTPIKTGFCLFRFTQGLRWTHISVVSEGAVSNIHMPPFLAVHLHKTKCICQLRPHYSSKEQMIAMILELRRYTYQVDRNSQFVVLFPPTSIHSAVLTPTLSSQVKGTKVRVTPSARRLYWSWTILLQEMAIHCHGSHSNSGFNTWVCSPASWGSELLLFLCHLARLNSVLFPRASSVVEPNQEIFLFVTFILSWSITTIVKNRTCACRFWTCSEDIFTRAVNLSYFNTWRIVQTERKIPPVHTT